MVKQDDATRRKWQLSPKFRLGPASLDVVKYRDDRSNLYALAARAKQLVSDDTGNLAYLGGASFIADRVHLYEGRFTPHMGWKGGAVACYRAETAVEGKPVFLALFGSASNLIGYRDEGGTGYYPSDIAGLYAILDAAREPGDPEISLRYRWDDSRFNAASRAERAVHFARQGASTMLGPCDFLALVHDEIDHAKCEGFVGRVIVGAPLWVRTAGPESPHGLLTKLGTRPPRR